MTKKTRLSRIWGTGVATLMAFGVMSFAVADTVSLGSVSGSPGETVSVPFSYIGDGEQFGLQGVAFVSDISVFEGGTDGIDMSGACSAATAFAASCIINDGDDRLQFLVSNAPGDPLGSFDGVIDFVIDASIDESMLPITVDLTWDTEGTDQDFTPNNAEHGQITITGAPVGECMLSIAPASHDFGEIAIGTSANQAFTITNTGEEACNDLMVEVTGDTEFSLGGSDCGAALGAGESCSADVTFSPDTEENFVGSLDVSAAEDGAVAALSGAGIIDDDTGPPGVVAIPTLQTWGLILMALLMLAIGTFSVRTIRS